MGSPLEGWVCELMRLWMCGGGPTYTCACMHVHVHTYDITEIPPMGIHVCTCICVHICVYEHVLGTAPKHPQFHLPTPPHPQDGTSQISKNSIYLEIIGIIQLFEDLWSLNTPALIYTTFSVQAVAVLVFSITIELSTQEGFSTLHQYLICLVVTSSNWFWQVTSMHDKEQCHITSALDIK